jgi:peptidoglycan/xylan/chitin deacetylase (PgdA/CDA1 family)
MKSPLVSLVETLGSSLPAYLSAARVWTFPGEESLKLALVDLAEDERSVADRAGRLLEERGHVVPRPTFPIAFTGLHDSDLGALLPRILDGLRGQVATFERLVESGGDADSIELLREARGVALRHADVLEDIGKHRAVTADPSTASR